MHAGSMSWCRRLWCLRRLEALGCRGVGDGGGMGNGLSPGRRVETVGFSPGVSGESVSGFCWRGGRFRGRRATGSVVWLTSRDGLGPWQRPSGLPGRRRQDGAQTPALLSRGSARDLEAQGKEPGAWSVWWVLPRGGSRQAPSRSTIARSCMERISSAGRNRAAFIHTLPHVSRETG